MPDNARDGHQHHLNIATAATAIPVAAAAAGALEHQDAAVAPPLSTSTTPPAADPVTISDALSHSFKVGLSGGSATVFSVCTMMWLHTVVTYQQRHGTNFRETCRILWREGGPRRFYRGVLPSFAAAPICRFGDTLSNELAMIWFNGQRAKASERRTQQSDGFGGIGGAHGEGALPLWVATLLGSVGAAAFHALVVPLDTYKVIMQVDGKAGMDVMRKRVALRGPLAAYDGALAFAGGSLMGHYPWYLTYNMLEQRIPQKKGSKGRRKRSAVIGAAASVVSAAASNAFRVLKVYRQSHDRPGGLTYSQSIKQIFEKDGGGARGAWGVLGRGLGGRVAASALQGLVFNVIWQEMALWSNER